jgi:integrase
VREFFTQYDDAVRDTMKRRSLETYRDVARLHLLPAVGGEKLKDLTREHVQRLYSQKRDAGLSAARVRRIHGVLSSALNHALRWGVIDHNVCKEVSPPRVPAPEIRPFNAEEAKRFLTAAQDDRFNALYVLGLTTGARIGELGATFWSDLDLERKVMRVQRVLITGRGGQTFEPPKTPNSHRSIGLSRRAIEALERHRERQRAKGLPVEGGSLVFTNTVGGPINPSHLLCRSFKPLLKKAGLPRTTFHAATRHTFCCLALQQGIDARTISLAMGHSSVAFTLTKYASYIPNYGDTAIGLDEALG